ncbi:MAG: hypothetical protein V3S55_08290 [Nitrospiraceae bacterium]
MSKLATLRGTRQFTDPRGRVTPAFPIGYARFKRQPRRMGEASRFEQTGDPFIGALIGAGIGLVGKLFKKKAAKGITALAKVRPSLPGFLTRAGGLARRAAPALAGVAAAGAAGAAFAGGERVITDAAGNVIGVRRRRRRGITARELSGFRKITRLLASVGMTPRGLGRHRHHFTSHK